MRFVKVKGYLSTAEVAARAGVDETTIRAYHSRKLMPRAEDHIGRNLFWREETIDAWLAERPGKGWKRDMRKGSRGGWRPVTNEA